MEGGFTFALQPDNLPKEVKPGQRRFGLLLQSGRKARIRIEFPLFLWTEVAEWWGKLTWSYRSSDVEGRQQAEVTWFELLVDFELTAGVKCQSPELEEQLPWGDRARVLMRVIKALLTCRGGGPGALKKNFGYSKRTASLAPFGLRHLPGLQRRPVFAAGLATTRAVGANACTWALAGSKGPLAKSQTDYKGFQLGRSQERSTPSTLQSTS